MKDQEEIDNMSPEEVLNYALDLAQENDQLKTQVARYEARDATIVKDNETLRGQATLAERGRREVMEENNRFRDQVHGLELELARVNGYADRVREFDPIPDKQLYRDRVPSRMMHDDEHRFDGVTVNTRSSAPWYRRG